VNQFQYKIVREMDHFIIVDIQGFQHKRSDFICKEISILKCDINRIYETHHYFFRFPICEHQLSVEFEKHMKWIQRNIHGISWEHSPSSTENYTDLQQILRECVPPRLRVYTKGNRKVHFLSELISNEIIDLTKIPKFSELKKRYVREHHCYEHINNNLQCAQENSKLLFNWIQEFPDEIREEEEEEEKINHVLKHPNDTNSIRIWPNSIPDM
jgi:hypothetical protein